MKLYTWFRTSKIGLTIIVLVGIVAVSGIYIFATGVFSQNSTLNQEAAAAASSSTVSVSFPGDLQGLLASLKNLFSVYYPGLNVPVGVLPTPSNSVSNTHFGIFLVGGNKEQAATLLGVQYLRMGINVMNPTPAQLKNVTDAESAGFKVIMGMSNGGVGAQAAQPVTNDAEYQSAFAADLDKIHPAMITIENEEDDPTFWAGTPAQYLHMLTLAAQVAHEKGYKITNGGIDNGGLSIAYWYHLWSTGDHTAADAFAKTVFVPLSQYNYSFKNIMSDIPNSQNPSVPIFGNNPKMAAKLVRVNEFIAGYHATGIDYINFHWYENDPSANVAAITWLEQTTGLQGMSNEMGVFQADPTYISRTLTAVVSLRLPYAIWFNTVGKNGVGPNTPLTNDTGTELLPNGVAFKQFISLLGTPSSSGASNTTPAGYPHSTGNTQVQTQ